MERFVKSDVVVIPFPFSDLSDSKRRPALVLANLKGYDIILCQITSQTVKDYYAISLTSKDFDRGELKQNSNIRPNRLFTADKKIILYKIGKINQKKHNETLDVIINLFTSH